MPKVTALHEQTRRSQIVSAAAICFARHGFAATSMPDIVGESSLSVGSLYHYFANKEDLFLAVVSERVALYADAFFASLAGQGPASARISAAFDHLNETLQQQSPLDARLSLELWSRAHDVDGLRDWLREARLRRVQSLREVLSQAQAGGEFRTNVDVDNAAATLLALADGMVVARACTPFANEAGNIGTGVGELISAWAALPGERQADE